MIRLGFGIAFTLLSLAANADCAKFETSWKNLCGTQRPSECRIQKPREIANALESLRELVAPRQTANLARKKFLETAAPTSKDAQNYYQAMATNCSTHELNFLRLMIRSSPQHPELKAILKRAITRSSQDSPTLLSAVIDLVALNEASQSGALTLSEKARKELKHVDSEAHIARGRIVREIKSHAMTDKPWEQPLVAQRLSKLEVNETARVRSQLAAWYEKHGRPNTRE